MKPTLGYGAAVLLILLASFAFDNEKIQTADNLPAYFSGAANFQPGRGWVRDAEEARRFWALPTAEERQEYRFQRSDSATPYDLHAEGYLYIVLASRNLLFWMGDVEGAEALQVLAHVLVTLFFLWRLDRTSSKLLFLLLYGLNPLILHIVTYPFYFYWQTLPSAFVLCYLLDRDLRFGRLAPVAVAAAAFFFMVRPTTLFIAALFLALLLVRESRRVAAVSVAVALLCGLAVLQIRPQNNLSPWFTVYVGIGAYPNEYVEAPLDEVGYRLYEERVGERYPFGGEQSAALVRLTEVTRAEALKIARESPLMFVRNAILNFFQAFSVGYPTMSLAAAYASSALGLVYCLVLLATRRFLFALAIALSALSFTPYYPPIPAYMFGSYILLVGAFVDLARDESLRRRLRSLAGLPSGAAPR